MTKEQLAIKLAQISQENKCPEKLSDYSIKSIREGRSSYPVSNLIDYCEGMELQMMMVDLATDEMYGIYGIMDVHNVIGMLMKRYNIDCQRIYRETSVHYTPPKNKRTSLSINTLLAVCSVLHCKIEFCRI